MAPSTRRPRRNKYGNVPTVVDGIRFQSLAEAKRYGELKLLQRAGQIRMLDWQPAYPLTVADKHIATYFGDFYYKEGGFGGGMFARPVCEDVKSKATRTPLWRLKWKLAKALYPNVEFREVMRGVPLRASSGRVGERAA